jgi:phenylacetate-CoA ligase
MNLLRALPRFQQAYRSLDELAARESWSREQIETFQLERLNCLWSHAIAHVPYYRTMFGRMSLPRRFDSLTEFQSVVPVLPKSTLQNSRDAFVSEQAPRGSWHYTGGSTGTNTRVFWAHDAHREMLRCRYRFYQSWGLDILDRTAYLWGHRASFAPGLPGYVARLRQPMTDWLRNRIRLSAYDLDETHLRRNLGRIAAFKPASIYSYSSAAHLLALVAERVGFRCDSLKAIVLTSEPAFPHIVNTVERAFGVPAVIEYGSTEGGLLAGEWPDRTLRVREDVTFLETQPRDDGRYDIVITALGNPSFPLVRYAIEDVTEAPVERPARGFSILKNVAGRNNDLIVSRSGRFLYAGYFDDVLDIQDGVRRYRVYQEVSGAITVTLELNESGSAPDLTQLQRVFEKYVEGYPVTVEVVDRIPPNPAGKHRWMISELAPRVANDMTACASALFASVMY